jgi:uncharacterized protein DUF2793
MSETYQYKLPLLQAAQAQKHVTVNEALAKLDALAQLRVQSRTQDVASAPVDGQSYIVPAGATGAWLGQDQKIALFLNGGWEFADAMDGWRAWVIDEAIELRFQSGSWGFFQPSIDTSLASFQFQTMEIDHTVSPGLDNVTAAVIPAQSVVIGLTGRVSQTITGPTDFGIGIAGSVNYYGSGYGIAFNTSLIALRSRVITYFADTPLILTANGGDFIDGSIRLAIHYTAFIPPAPF